jgi:hypothetical protein
MIKRQPVKSGNQVKLTFVQPYDETKPRTFVVGSFNEWSPTATPLVKRSNGTASASITVDAGAEVHFRYYTEAGAWFNDEAADSYEQGSFGEDNSVVVA